MGVRGGVRALLALVPLMVLGCDGQGPAAVADAGVDAGCLPGYAPTATGSCVDVDECVENDEACDALTACFNLPGTYTCGACPMGYRGTGATGCVLDCADGEHDGGDGTCQPLDACSPGFEPADGVCAPLECGPDEHFGGASGCVPLGTCDPGFEPNRRGRCVPIEEGCPDGEHDDGTGECAPEGTCAEGFEPNDDGDCVEPAQQGCPDGEHDDGTGECAPEGTCAEGFEPNADGDCVPIEEGCPAGQHDDGTGECAPEGTCAFGFVLDGEGDCQALSCPADDGLEPDDTPDESTALAPGVEAVGIACADDADVFAVDAAAGCQVRATIGPVAPALTAELIDADGQRVTAGAPDGDVIRLSADTLRQVFVRVAGAGAPYRVTYDAAGHDGGDGACVDDGVCSPGWALDDAGDCSRCADDHHDGGDGACTPLGTCSPGFVDGGDGSCVRPGACPDGFRDDGLGACIADDAPCARGFHEGGGGACAPLGACADGFALDRLDACRALADCPGNRDDGLGRCSDSCAPGYQNGGGDPAACLPLGDCQDGARDRGDGVCGVGCLPGFALNDAGDCVGDFQCPADDDLEPAPTLADGQTRGGVLCPGTEDVFTVATPIGCGARLILRADAAEGELVLEAGAPDALQAAVIVPRGGRLVLADLGPEVRVRVRGVDSAQSARYAVRIDVDGHDGGDGRCVPLAECSPGYTLADDDSGACDRCDVGFHDGGDGACVPDDRCSPGYVDSNGDDPGTECLTAGSCARGYHDGGDGRCAPRGTCAQGFNDDGAGRCVAFGDACADGYERLGIACICAFGTRDGGDGTCVAEGACSPGFQPNAPGGDCTPIGACEPDHHATPWGTCRPTETGCAPGTRDDGIGRCTAECAPGFDDGGEDICVAAPACADGFADGGTGACIPTGGCAEGHRPAAPSGVCIADLQCPGPGTDDPDLAPILAYGDRVDGVLCGARDGDLWRIDARAGCGGIVTLVADDGAGTADLELLDGDLDSVRLVESDGGVARAVLAPDADVRAVRVRQYGDGPVGYVLRVDRDPTTCPGDCGGRTRSDGTGVCIDRNAPCADGFRDGGNATCVPLDRCAGGFHDDGFGACTGWFTCAEGARLGLDGDCDPAAECGGVTIDDGTGRCDIACAMDYRDGGAGACFAADFCAPGFADDGAGRCVERLAGAACGGGFTATADGLCLAGTCDDGDPQGDTIDDAEPVDVPIDGVLRIDGSLCDGDAGDVYLVDVLPGCEAVLAALRFDHAEGDLLLALLDEGGSRLLPAADTADDDEVIGLEDPPETVGIEVSRARVGGQPVRYRLDVQFRCVD